VFSHASGCIRAKEARSGIDRAKLFVTSPSADVIDGKVFDADLDDVSGDLGAESAPQYGEQDYWESRFQKESLTNTAFEWSAGCCSCLSHTITKLGVVHVCHTMAARSVERTCTLRRNRVG
jgi:hypothetical protein